MSDDLPKEIEIKASDLLLEIFKSNKELFKSNEEIIKWMKSMDFKYTILISKLDKLSNKSPTEMKIPTKGLIENIATVKPSDSPLSFPDVESKHAKTSIYGCVLYGENAPVPMTLVKLYDENKQPLEDRKPIRTAADGKYNFTLPAGRYYIQLVKASIAGKPKVDHTFELILDGKEKTKALGNYIVPSK